MAVGEDELIVVKYVDAHAEGDIGWDRVVFVLDGRTGGHAGETLGSAVAESERYSGSKGG